MNCLVGKTPAGVDANDVHATLVGQPSLRRAASSTRRHRTARRADQPIRHTRLLPDRTTQALESSSEVGAGTCYCNTTSTHADHGRRAGPHDRARIYRGSRTCRSPTIRAETSPAPARSTSIPVDASSTALGYDGWIGCEYKPADDTVGGSAWMGPYLHKGRERPWRTIGFIGLGIMGTPMAPQSVKGGHHAVPASRSGVRAGTDCGGRRVVRERQRGRAAAPT